VMTYPFPDESFDLVALVATIHHLQLRPALIRLRKLLKPGGVLAIVGLYRGETLTDSAVAAVAFPVSWIFRLVRGYADVGAPVQEPRETLAEIRRECDLLLPGATLRRRLLFRYSLIWRKAPK
jgi:SAM-dependent methyltransferase